MVEFTGSKTVAVSWISNKVRAHVVATLSSEKNKFINGLKWPLGLSFSCLGQKFLAFQKRKKKSINNFILAQ